MIKQECISQNNDLSNCKIQNLKFLLKSAVWLHPFSQFNWTQQSFGCVFRILQSCHPIHPSRWAFRCDYINTKLIHINISAAIEPRLGRVITTSVVALSRFLPVPDPFPTSHTTHTSSRTVFLLFCERKAKGKGPLQPWWQRIHFMIMTVTALAFPFSSVRPSLWELQGKFFLGGNSFRFPLADSGPFPVWSGAF